MRPASRPFTDRDRRANEALNSIGCLPCEQCGGEKPTKLREPTAGERMRMCEDCGGRLPRAGAAQ